MKSLRAGKAQLVDSYVLLKDGEAWLMGAHITPLTSASTHVIADPTRTRKLLLNRRELGKLFGAVQQKGYACVALSLYWKKHMIKCEIALAKGKKEFDKRHTEKNAIPIGKSSAPCAPRARTTDQLRAERPPPRPPTPQHPSPRLCDAPTLSCRRCARASRWASCWPSASTSCT